MKKEVKTVQVFNSILKETDFWQTPDNLKNAISRYIIPFNWLHDPCPEDPGVDGLSREDLWEDNNYINPPFSGKHQLEWGKECVYRVGRESDMCLLQIRFDPTASHFKYLMGNCHTVWMPDKRLKYLGAKDSYNFPIAVYEIREHPPLWPAFRPLVIE